MKLNDLISALADEIEIIRPELQVHLEELISSETNDDVFFAAAEFYTEQTGRMGEAAEMVGFPGLQGVCDHVSKNIEQLSKGPVHERAGYDDFLKTWPNSVVYYLKNIEDTSAAAGLVDFLRAAPAPIQEEEALKIMHQLGSFPGTIESEENEASYRPVLASIELVSLEVPKDVDQSLLEGFFQEAPQQAERLVQLLNEMVSSELSSDKLAEAKRIVHTIKGTGAIIGISGLANLGHHFEDILEFFENKGGHVEPKITSILLDGGHCISQMIAHMMGADEFPSQSVSVFQNILDLANMLDRGDDLNNVQFRNDTAVSNTPAVANVANVGSAPSKQKGALRIGLDRIESLFQTSAELSVNSSALESQIKSLLDFSKRLNQQQLRVKKRLFELGTIVDTKSLSMMQSKDSDINQSTFDPLELEQYNELHSSTHALMEEFNDAVLAQQQIDKSLASLSTMKNKNQILARDLQHLIIGTRMSEVSTLESRLQRNIRTTCQMTGKQASLIITGGDTLIDSDVLNKLAEPLLHLLRNAVDHGIEDEDDRIAAGKDPVGSITIDFASQGQQIIMTCKDDGKGLDYDRILQRSIENGLVEEGENLTEKEIAKLIFMPGFSTRDQVSEVSGRGVGLDVVRNWLTTVNGSIDITSVSGQNTTMVMLFASSLTTVQSLIVEVDKQSFALPSIQVVQALSHDEGNFVEENNSLQYRFNDKVYGARYLSDVLGLKKQLDSDQLYSILVRVGDEEWAIGVDRLIDSRELLLKKPGDYLRHIKGINGTSILGDGSVAIHLDIPKLLQTSSDSSYTHHSSNDDSSSSSLDRGLPLILVVDDSLSVRNTLRELLEDSGYLVQTARDGIEAVSALEDINPRLVLTDLEMPNMNGVELTTHIRNSNRIGNMPIIMITSRSQEMHRKMATDAGVNGYFTKPYIDIDLLKKIQELLAS